ncbi:MAG: hypothetical protein KDD11_17220, partial [Acidobacteria bacterium]|nr:hypothetical protein [Acidobacteriota bacterium]
LALLASVPAQALVERDGSPFLAAKQVRHPGLYIGNVYVAGDQLTGTQDGGRSAGLLGLGINPANAFLDLRSGRWGTLMLSEPLIPGDGVGNALTWQGLRTPAPTDDQGLEAQAWQALHGFLDANKNQLDIEPAELMPRAVATGAGDLVQIHGQRVFAGVPVRDSFMTAVISHGNLILLGFRTWDDITVSPFPEVDREAAVEVVRSYLRPTAMSGLWDRTELVYVPLAKGALPTSNPVGDGYAYRLAWAVRPDFTGHFERFEALVDAKNGEILSFEDTAHYATPREVVGAVLPVSNDGVAPDGVEQSGWPMPYADVTVGGTTYFTDGGGNLPACVDGTIETELKGRFLSMNDTCGALLESDAGSPLDLGTSPGTDCNVAGGASAGNTRASRSGYYEMNQLKEAARGYLDGNGWLDATLISNMNINDTCNASWNGQVNFFASGGGCNNTGEIAGVFDHEWGHGMDNNGVNPNIANPGEGIADVFASLRLNTSCIGRNFRATNCTGFGDPCTSCTGVREIDFAKRASGNPHGIAFIDANCGSGPAPCGGGVHCEGQVFAESIWDLYNRDLRGAPYNMDLNTALEAATRLTFVGSGPVGSWYTCVNGTATGDGCNADGGYLNYLAADDDNGNLADGTPHMTAIFNAFNRHSIACGSPTVTDSGCAGGPSSAPTVSVSPLDRGAHVTWTSVAGATRYNVFRTDGVLGCDFGKIKIAETTSLEFYDSELQNGRDYYYSVTAVGASDACFGPMSSCTTGTPAAGANLSIDTASASFSFSGGDGDDFLDNCETATASFNVDNIGTGSLTNVRITEIQSLNHPDIQILTALPATVAASLAECGPGAASFGFSAAGLSYQDTVELQVTVTADEIAPQTRVAVLTLGQVESDIQSFATKTFDFETSLDGWTVGEGTFGQSTALGGGDGTATAMASSTLIDNACDRIRSPEVRLTATSTLSLWNNYEIEPFSGGTWYDRANVALVDSSGGRTAVEPDSGRTYNASSPGVGNFSGCLEPEPGWADNNLTWGTSGWSAAALGSVAAAGQPRFLEVTYSTDGGLALRGFSFDQLTLTNFDLQVQDGQLNTCNISGTVFGAGFETGDFSEWTSHTP